MPILLTPIEKRVAKRLAEVKRNSGSHSPSPAMLAGIKGVAVTHDFCYLSNPHATELFLRYAKRDFTDDKMLRSIVEYYPSQNRALSKKLERISGVAAQNIFVGNGATEIIQAVLQTFVGVKLPQTRRSLAPTKLLVPVPTFSPYLEFAPKGVRVIQHQLRKEDDFRLHLAELLTQARKEEPDTVVIINPNNPNGGYIDARGLQGVLAKLRHLSTVVVDESFLHFTAQTLQSAALLVKKHPNLVVVKSLSKDFGIAGLRLGYAVMSEERVSELLGRGYLWNVSGFGEYFLGLLNRRGFLRQYEHARLQAIWERDEFFTTLSRVRGLKVYPSKANMFLVELVDGSQARDLVVALLVRHGIYIRLCKDKVGLEGEFVRIASRSGAENRLVTNALRAILSM